MIPLTILLHVWEHVSFESQRDNQEYPFRLTPETTALFFSVPEVIGASSVAVQLLKHNASKIQIKYVVPKHIAKFICSVFFTVTAFDLTHEIIEIENHFVLRFGFQPAFVERMEQEINNNLYLKQHKEEALRAALTVLIQLDWKEIYIALFRHMNNNLLIPVNLDNEIVSSEPFLPKIISNEIISDEIISNEIISDEIISDEIISNEIISNEIISDEKSKL